MARFLNRSNFLQLLCVFAHLRKTESKALELGDSATALLPLVIFDSLSANVAAVSMNLEEYVPLSSRAYYRGEYKVWPKTFNTFLLRLPLKTMTLVKFLLYTKKSPPGGEPLIPWETESFTRSSWNSAEKIKILVHGYMQNSQTMNMPVQLLRAYQSMNSTSNIVLVDWSVLAAQPYFESAMYSYLVGKVLTEFIVFAKMHGFIKSYRAVHIVGSGLGAHVAGAAGYHLIDRAGTGAILGRITGLDPSGPGFYSVRLELRLDAHDADFVDVIHTNGGFHYRSGQLGFPGNLGMADFYPNGGLLQPICDDLRVPPKMISACHHLKAADYYRRSILTELFLACPCDAWGNFDKEACPCKSGPHMGEYATRSAGKYYLHVFEHTLFELFEKDGLTSKR